MRLSAARMVQTAAEMASRYQRLPAPALLMGQIAVNLLEDPGAGQTTLFDLGEAV